MSPALTQWFELNLLFKLDEGTIDLAPYMYMNVSYNTLYLHSYVQCIGAHR